MIKETVIGAYSKINPVLADRYLLRFHGPEVVHVSGPWLRRYVTYRAYDPPPEAAERFGAKKGRYIEIWFSNIEEYASRPGMGSFSSPPWDTAAEMRETERAMAILPALPTEDFLGKEPKAEETTILRWCCAIRYPEGVSVEEGEKWYLETHSQEAKQQPGLLRYISYRAIEDLGAPPGSPPPGAPPGGSMPARIPWVRVSELWYEDFAAWRKAVIESPPSYTPPPWGGEYPFVHMDSNFIDLKPDIDFLRGNTPIP